MKKRRNLNYHKERIVELQTKLHKTIHPLDRERLQIAIRVHEHLATCPRRHSMYGVEEGCSYVSLYRRNGDGMDI